MSKPSLLNRLMTSATTTPANTAYLNPQANPFLRPLSTPTPAKPNIPTQEVGVNQPLKHPLFVGYRDDKPVYAGSRLFVLY